MHRPIQVRCAGSSTKSCKARRSTERMRRWAKCWWSGSTWSAAARRWTSSSPSTDPAGSHRGIERMVMSKPNHSANHDYPKFRAFEGCVSNCRERALRERRYEQLVLVLSRLEQDDTGQSCGLARIAPDDECPWFG